MSLVSSSTHTWISTSHHLCVLLIIMYAYDFIYINTDI